MIMTMLDQGAGGGGTSTYADGLLNDWTDKDGRKHRGLIDKEHDIYKGYDEIYPNAVNKLRLLSPKKYRTQMVEEFIELIDLSVIKFPYEYKQEFISMAKQIDEENQQMESYKYENAEKTTRTYALSKEKENDPNFHDDRFYTIIMLAHYLYGLRRGQTVQSTPQEKFDYNSAPSCVSNIDF